MVFDIHLNPEGNGSEDIGQIVIDDLPEFWMVGHLTCPRDNTDDFKEQLRQISVWTKTTPIIGRDGNNWVVSIGFDNACGRATISYKKDKKMMISEGKIRPLEALAALALFSDYAESLTPGVYTATYPLHVSAPDKPHLADIVIKTPEGFMALADRYDIDLMSEMERYKHTITGWAREDDPQINPQIRYAQTQNVVLGKVQFSNGVALNLNAKNPDNPEPGFKSSGNFSPVEAITAIGIAFKYIDVVRRREKE